MSSLNQKELILRSYSRRSRAFLPAVAFAYVLALGACTTTAPRHNALYTPAGDGVGVTLIREAFLATGSSGAEVDSVTTWLTPDGDTWVIATAKYAGSLVVFDGGTGELLHGVGDLVELAYPNGVTTFGDALFVVERDSARVQILSLPDFTSIGSFGEHVLTFPYGIWLRESAPGEVEVYITDSYQNNGAVPELSELDHRIRRFRVRLNEDPIRAWAIDALGGTNEKSALRWVESIRGDVAFNRLAIAEEHPDFTHNGIAIYTLDGQYTGERLGKGLFQGDPEGIALYECLSGNGYWIATDQGKSDNRFHVFDRASLSYLGSFSGEKTLNTDGIVLHSGASQRFPYGVLYAVHDDRGVAAFDWRDIAEALNLWLDCPE